MPPTWLMDNKAHDVYRDSLAGPTLAALAVAATLSLPHPVVLFAIRSSAQAAVTFCLRPQSGFAKLLSWLRRMIPEPGKCCPLIQVHHRLSLSNALQDYRTQFSASHRHRAWHFSHWIASQVWTQARKRRSLGSVHLAVPWSCNERIYQGYEELFTTCENWRGMFMLMFLLGLVGTGADIIAGDACCWPWCGCGSGTRELVQRGWSC